MTPTSRKLASPGWNGCGAIDVEEPIFPLVGRRVWVAGHRGMVGAAITRRLLEIECEVLTADRDDLDLTRQNDAEAWLAEHRPDVVVLAAAKVGGIHANSTRPVDFILDNLQIQNNVIRGAHETGVSKLLFLGSSCIYPRNAPQPMSESALLTGALEPTNEWYAVAKIAGMKLCQAFRRQYGSDFISLMPTNLYGPGDNYHPTESHVPAALIRRFHEAKLAGDPTVTVWGTGSPLREFLFVDDLADACAFVLEHYSDDQFLNVGTQKEISIAEFAKTVMAVVGYQGELVFDTTKPDGAPRKLLDVSALDQLGWRASTQLFDGLKLAYGDFLAGGGRFNETAPAV